MFSFATEDRTQCLETGAVSYRRSTSTHLALHVPLETAVNAADVERYKERQVRAAIFYFPRSITTEPFRLCERPPPPSYGHNTRHAPQAKRQKLKDSSATAYIGAAPLEGAEGSAAADGAAASSEVVTTSEGGGKDVSFAVTIIRPWSAWIRSDLHVPELTGFLHSLVVP